MSAADELRGLRREIGALRREVRDLREALDNAQFPQPYVPYVPVTPPPYSEPWSPGPYYPNNPYITWRFTWGREIGDPPCPPGLSSPVEMT